MAVYDDFTEAQRKQMLKAVMDAALATPVDTWDTEGPTSDVDGALMGVAVINYDDPEGKYHSQVVVQVKLSGPLPDFADVP